jgi:hypothetical protein
MLQYVSKHNKENSNKSRFRFTLKDLLWFLRKSFYIQLYEAIVKGFTKTKNKYPYSKIQNLPLRKYIDKFVMKKRKHMSKKTAIIV